MGNNVTISSPLTVGINSEQKTPDAHELDCSSPEIRPDTSFSAAALMDLRTATKPAPRFTPPSPRTIWSPPTGGRLPRPLNPPMRAPIPQRMPIPEFQPGFQRALSEESAAATLVSACRFLGISIGSFLGVLVVSVFNAGDTRQPEEDDPVEVLPLGPTTCSPADGWKELTGLQFDINDLERQILIATLSGNAQLAGILKFYLEQVKLKRDELSATMNRDYPRTPPSGQIFASAEGEISGEAAPATDLPDEAGKKTNADPEKAPGRPAAKSKTNFWASMIASLKASASSFLQSIVGGSEPSDSPSTEFVAVEPDQIVGPYRLITGEEKVKISTDSGSFEVERWIIDELKKTDNFTDVAISALQIEFKLRKKTSGYSAARSSEEILSYLSRGNFGNVVTKVQNIYRSNGGKPVKVLLFGDGDGHFASWLKNESGDMAEIQQISLFPATPENAAAFSRQIIADINTMESLPHSDIFIDLMGAIFHSEDVPKTASMAISGLSVSGEGFFVASDQAFFQLALQGDRNVSLFWNPIQFGNTPAFDYTRRLESSGVIMEMRVSPIESRRVFVKVSRFSNDPIDPVKFAAQLRSPSR